MIKSLLAAAVVLALVMPNPVQAQQCGKQIAQTQQNDQPIVINQSQPNRSVVQSRAVAYDSPIYQPGPMLGQPIDNSASLASFAVPQIGVMSNIAQPARYAVGRSANIAAVQRPLLASNDREGLLARFKDKIAPPFRQVTVGHRNGEIDTTTVTRN